MAKLGYGLKLRAETTGWVHGLKPRVETHGLKPRVETHGLKPRVKTRGYLRPSLRDEEVPEPGGRHKVSPGCKPWVGLGSALATD